MVSDMDDQDEDGGDAHSNSKMIVSSDSENGSESENSSEEEKEESDE
jgi:hypothetical protein